MPRVGMCHGLLSLAEVILGIPDHRVTKHFTVKINLRSSVGHLVILVIVTLPCLRI